MESATLLYAAMLLLSCLFKSSLSSTSTQSTADSGLSTAESKLQVIPGETNEEIVTNGLDESLKPQQWQSIPLSLVKFLRLYETWKLTRNAERKISYDRHSDVITLEEGYVDVGNTGEEEPPGKRSRFIRGPKSSFPLGASILHSLDLLQQTIQASKLQSKMKSKLDRNQDRLTRLG